MNSPTAVVTGAAGFIGSHLTESLLAAGWSVRGIDCFTEYYSADQKRHNLAAASTNAAFDLAEEDLARTPQLAKLLSDSEVLFHFAAEAGVRSSWGEGFDRYVTRNLLATQRLLEAAREVPTLKKIVVASSSSVYGDAETFPTPEDGPTRPVSPYGITKLATEHLAMVYARNWGLPTISLRLFTVFGPRQRPDMAFHRIIEAAVTGKPFTIYGQGNQVRDFTYVGDVVRAALAAAEADVTPGLAVNVAGGTSTALNEAIQVVESLCGASVARRQGGSQPGDARRTGGDTRRARDELGWSAEVNLTEGLARQVDWHKNRVEGSTTVGRLTEGLAQ